MFAASKSGSADAKDPQFNYVTMLLHGNGTNGAQNNTFTDSSTNNFTITRNGNTTQGTFSPYGSNWSNSFATNSAIRYPYTSSLTSWWTQNFTIEMWVFNNTNAVSGTNSLPLQFAHGVYNSTPTYWAFGTNASGQLNFYYYNGGSNNVTSTTAASLGTWNHIAMVYTHSSGNISLYLNGVSVASATKSGTPQNDNTNTVNIGAVQSTYYNGYISNLRVLNGTALYSGSFTPSTTPLTAITNTQLLTCADNRFIDDSTNNATPTIIGSPSIQRFSQFSPTSAYSTSVIGGSGYFDGSGDYLIPTSSPAFAYGTGDLTFECWIYATTASDSPIYESRSTNSNTDGFTVTAFSSTVIRVYTNGVLVTATVANYVNAWTHVAYTRQGSTNRLFVNGVLSATATASDNFSNTTAIIGGGRYPNSSVSAYFTGYIADVRILKGTAQYTASFTPPTAPLTPVTNTSLLLSYTNAAISDNAMMNDLETVGNAQISTSVKKYGTGSMYFDGTGDYLTAPSNAYFAIGATEDYTVECWVNFSVVQTCGFYQATNNISSATGQFWFGYEGGQLKSSQHGSSTYAVGYTWSPSTGTWYHVAATRASGTVRLFINGTVVTTNTTTQNGISFTQSGAAVGVLTTPSYMNGYIDDLRITKGVARYTASFTPPTAAFADKG